jgi:hypothetical protein
MGSKAFLILGAALFIVGSIVLCQTARGAAESSVLEVYPAPLAFLLLPNTQCSWYKMDRQKARLLIKAKILGSYPTANRAESLHRPL